MRPNPGDVRESLVGAVVRPGLPTCSFALLGDGEETPELLESCHLAAASHLLLATMMILNLLSSTQKLNSLLREKSQSPN